MAILRRKKISFGDCMILPVAGPDFNIIAIALLAQPPVILLGIKTHLRPLPRNMLDLGPSMAEPNPQIGIEGKAVSR